MKAYTAEPEPVVTESLVITSPAVESDRAAVTADAARLARRKTDRLLLLVLGGMVTLLVLAGLSLVLLRGPQSVLPADTPGGTVQRFLDTIENENYDEAYNYLSWRMFNKPTREEYVMNHMDFGGYAASRAARSQVGRESISGNSATVEVTINDYSTSSWPFGGAYDYTYTETFTLVREKDVWLITDLPWTYGAY